jgi:2-hydroxy-4-carboxymuconate semialdehyde hemiacetal dehydrogenase
MNKKDLNMAFVGYGSIAASHARALRELGGVRFDSVVGRVPESTEAFAKEWDFAHWTLALEEALARPGLDAVVICSPSEMHAAQAEQSLRAGKHVLAEIPLAMSAAETAALERTARATQRCLMVAHTQRFFPALIELRRRVQAGEFHAHHAVCRWFFLRRENVNWMGRRRSWTDNLLWHHSCHVVDAVLWSLDLPEVRDIRGQFGLPHAVLGVPLDLDIQFRTATGALVHIAMSYNSHAAVHDYAFIGEETTLTYANNRLVAADGNAVVEGRDNPIREQDREFLAAVRAGRESSVSAASVLPAMQVLQALQDQGF